MGSRSDNFLAERILAELKQINEKLDKKPRAGCRKCKGRNQTIKQLRVEKEALLKYIKELEGFMNIEAKQIADRI